MTPEQVGTLLFVGFMLLLSFGDIAARKEKVVVAASEMDIEQDKTILLTLNSYSTRLMRMETRYDTLLDEHRQTEKDLQTERDKVRLLEGRVKELEAENTKLRDELEALRKQVEGGKP